MLCPVCQSEARKFGKDRDGNQRFQCTACKKTFADRPARPLGDMRLEMGKAIQCIQLIAEGNSIRSTTRITGVSLRTVLDLLVLVGERCEQPMYDRIKAMPVKDVQCDEVWGFVGMKEKTRKRKCPDAEQLGDAYCFTAIERDTKMLIAWHLGTRITHDAEFFVEKLAYATTGRFQVTTDGFKPYAKAIAGTLPQSDFAILVKQYATMGDEGRYSPGEVTGTVKTPCCGAPDPSRICTSHVERHNLTIRMQNRRMTRLTNGFSKKWENHSAALALQFAYYNFCRIHSTIKMTPAMKAGIEDHPWSLEELIVNSAPADTATSTH